MSEKTKSSGSRVTHQSVVELGFRSQRPGLEAHTLNPSCKGASGRARPRQMPPPLDRKVRKLVRVGKLRAEKPQSRWESWKLPAPRSQRAKGMGDEGLGSEATSPWTTLPPVCLPCLLERSPDQPQLSRHLPCAK